MIGPTYTDLFALIVDEQSESLRQQAARLGRIRARDGTLAGLSPSQVSGVAVVALRYEDVERMRLELQRRNEMRWAARGEDKSPLPVLEADLRELSDGADAVLREAEKTLGTALDEAGAGIMPQGRDWHGELTLALARVYLMALVTATRTRTTASISQGEGGHV